MNPSDKALPPCQKCNSYKVTWDTNQPHACLFFGFKSSLLPSLEVYHSTGRVCPQYRLSKAHKRQAEEHEEEQGFAGHLSQYRDELEALEDYPINHLKVTKESSLKNEHKEEHSKKRGGYTRELGYILGEKGILG